MKMEVENELYSIIVREDSVISIFPRYVPMVLTDIQATKLADTLTWVVAVSKTSEVLK